MRVGWVDVNCVINTDKSVSQHFVMDESEIDADRLAKHARRDLPSHQIRHIEELEGYEHMDVLWSKDAHERVFTVILDIIKGVSTEQN